MLSKEDIIVRVNETFVSEFEIDPALLKPEANLFTDLELDSLDGVDMLIHLEDNMGVKFDSEVFKEVRTLGDIYTKVEQLIAQHPEMEKRNSDTV
ncbi:MAG: acyl carrier protein [Bacteriovoracaceae bacterium]|nr:acyl carrier protein [Bacteriovoracaceae bacterium]